MAVGAGAADVAGEVHAVAAVGAAGGRRRGDERRVGVERVVAVQAALAAGDRADDAAAHVEVGGDLALREFSFTHEAVDFVGECGGKHGECGI